MARRLAPYLYFAYGSNLCRERMASRCPAARPIGRLAIRGFRLVMRRAADVVEGGPSDELHGALYEVTQDCEAALDRAEGYQEGGKGSYDKLVFEFTLNEECARALGRPVGSKATAMLYFMSRDKGAAPQASYIETVRRGYRDWDLPRDRLVEALASSPAMRGLRVPSHSNVAHVLVKRAVDRLKKPKARPATLGGAGEPIPEFLRRPEPKTLAPAPKRRLLKETLNYREQADLFPRGSIELGPGCYRTRVGSLDDQEGEAADDPDRINRILNGGEV